MDPLHLLDSSLFLPLFSIRFAILYVAKEKPVHGRPAGSGVNLVGVICYVFTSLDDQILHNICHEQRCKYIVTGAGLAKLVWLRLLQMVIIGSPDRGVCYNQMYK
jgi:hypothetical protein